MKWGLHGNHTTTADIVINNGKPVSILFLSMLSYLKMKYTNRLKAKIIWQEDYILEIAACNNEHVYIEQT